MATYDRTSQEGICQEVALFATPLTNITCKYVNNVAYYPQTSVSGSSKVIEFVVKSSDQYIDLASLVLNLELKCVVRKPKSDNAVTKKCFLENNLLSTIFERVDVLLSDKELSHTNDYYMYSYLYLLLNSRTTEQENSLQSAGFYMAEPGQQESMITNVGGFDNRTITPEKTLYLSGPVYVPITLNRKWIVPGIPITLRFHLSNESLWTLQKSEDPLYGLDIKGCKLKVKQCSVNDRIRFMHEQQGLKNPFIYILPDYQLTRRAMATGQKSYIFENLPSVYSKLFVVFVLEKGLVGDVLNSPFNFKPLNVNKITLQTGSLTRSYDQIDCEKGSFDDSFAELQRCLGNEHVPYSLKRMMKEPIFAFSLSPTNDNFMLPPRSEHNVRVSVELSEPYRALIPHFFSHINR